MIPAINSSPVVMAGFIPAIHVFFLSHKEDVDARDICAKTRFALLPGHDEHIMTSHKRHSIARLNHGPDAGG